MNIANFVEVSNIYREEGQRLSFLFFSPFYLIKKMTVTLYDCNVPDPKPNVQADNEAILKFCDSTHCNEKPKVTDMPKKSDCNCKSPCDHHQLVENKVDEVLKQIKLKHNKENIAERDVVDSFDLKLFILDNVDLASKILYLLYPNLVTDEYDWNKYVSVWTEVRRDIDVTLNGLNTVLKEEIKSDTRYLEQVIKFFSDLRQQLKTIVNKRVVDKECELKKQESPVEKESPHVTEASHGVCGSPGGCSTLKVTHNTCWQELNAAWFSKHHDASVALLKRVDADELQKITNLINLLINYAECGTLYFEEVMSLTLELTRRVGNLVFKLNYYRQALLYPDEVHLDYSTEGLQESLTQLASVGGYLIQVFNLLRDQIIPQIRKDSTLQ
jgi:hypothetical protein